MREAGLPGVRTCVVAQDMIEQHDFDRFVRVEGEQVRRALVARYGVEIGSEVAADAMAAAWERWAEFRVMDNPAGYLFRIGQSRARPHVRWATRGRLFPGYDLRPISEDSADLVDLLRSLRRLTPDQRTALLLVKSYGYSHREVAELLDINEGAVNNLVHRGLARLRSLMEVSK